jgi:hypothetical protein
VETLYSSDHFFRTGQLRIIKGERVSHAVNAVAIAEYARVRPPTAARRPRSCGSTHQGSPMKTD